MSHSEIAFSLKQSIELSLAKFSELSVSRKVTIDVEVRKTDQGQFLITVRGVKRNVIVSHGWKDKTSSYAKPSTIDILLDDCRGEESYVIYMTECEIELFPNLLDEAFIIAEKFLKQEYQKQSGKIFGLFRREFKYSK